MVLANIIRKDKKVPIIMLSAKSEDYDKISGLKELFIDEIAL